MQCECDIYRESAEPRSSAGHGQDLAGIEFVLDFAFALEREVIGEGVVVMRLRSKAHHDLG